MIYTNSFNKAIWVNHTNVYEVNLRQYTDEGTFNAFAKHLERLKDMGVETLWFMPLTPISEEKKKGTMGSYYACSDYISVNPEFGTLDDFISLVKEAHSMGFKVIIDWVANHTGWDHSWTRSNPGYFKIDPLTGTFQAASGMDDIIELDFSNPSLRAAMIDAMLFWVRSCDIDGFRCDLAFWVTLDFWMEARTEIEKEKTLFWLAESDPLEFPAYYQAFDACYTWTWMHKTAGFYKDELDLATLKQVLDQYDVVCGKENLPLWFTTNHDENSWNGTEYEKYGDMALMLAVFSCTWSGIPLVYSGQELPVKKRLKFFDKDTIEWNGQNELHAFYKTLLNLHSVHPALCSRDTLGSTFVIPAKAGEHCLTYLRKNRESEVLVVLNFSRLDIEIELKDDRLSRNYIDIFHGSAIDLTLPQVISLAPWDYRVFVK